MSKNLIYRTNRATQELILRHQRSSLRRFSEKDGPSLRRPAKNRLGAIFGVCPDEEEFIIPDMAGCFRQNRKVSCEYIERLKKLPCQQVHGASVDG